MSGEGTKRPTPPSSWTPPEQKNIVSKMPANVNSALPVHVIIKLPYNRPEGAVDPPVVVWTSEKEALLWDIISSYRGSETSGIDWPALSERLAVPLPFLMYRAQVRYEEDLRGLQGGLSTPQPQLNTKLNVETRMVDRSANSTPVKPSLVGLRNLPSPLSRQPTPIAIPNRILSQHRSPYGLQSSQILQRQALISASTATLQGRPLSAHPVAVSPVTSRRAPSPPSPSSSSSSPSEDEEEEKEREEIRQQAGRQLKELEKLMSSQVLGFARPKVDPNTSSKHKEKLTLSMVREPQRALSSGPASNLSSIPSIPSPPPDNSPKILTTNTTIGKGGINATPAGPVMSPHTPANQMVRSKILTKQPTTVERATSNYTSSTSSFSDMSDASVSTSALEDALNSNFKQGGGSRTSTTSRSRFGSRQWPV